MKKKCIITTKQHFIQKVDIDIDIYYIEDYIGFGNITKARLLTDDIFKNNKEFIDKFDYRGYKITWGQYDKVYQFALKYMDIEKLLFLLKERNYFIIDVRNIEVSYQNVISKYFFDKNVITSIKKQSNMKEFIINSILIIFSMISIIYFIIRRKNYVGIRTEDMIYRDKKCDFRLVHLYEKLEENSIDYIEFIRTKNLKTFFQNTLKRKRFAIYYDSIIYFSKLFNFKSYRKPMDFYEAVLFGYNIKNQKYISSINFLKIIYKLLNIQYIFLFNFGSRSIILNITAKILQIPSIDIMHGLSQKDYIVQEFMEAYNEDKYIGPDIYGVWSQEYVKYYRKFCKIVPKQNIIYSGLLRPVNTKVINKHFKLISKKPKILIISEPLVNPIEILPYLKYLIESNKFEIGIKVRPMIKDIFYEKLKKLYPTIAELKTYDGQILEDGKRFDIFLGSHSTAVVEASLLGKLSILVKTEKWGDYFQMNDLIENKKLLCDKADHIISYIEYRIKEENNLNTIEKIRTKFFGDNKDGVEFLIKKFKD